MSIIGAGIEMIRVSWKRNWITRLASAEEHIKELETAWLNVSKSVERIWERIDKFEAVGSEYDWTNEQVKKFNRATKPKSDLSDLTVREFFDVFDDMVDDLPSGEENPITAEMLMRIIGTLRTLRARVRG